MTNMHAVFAIVLVISATETSNATSYVVPRLDPEVDMNTTQLITSKGYPCEDYDVHTSDGYILSVQRIPRGKNDQNLDVARPAVLLQHGLLSCSACWVENLVNESLGFMLADAGYDVWLGNSRGNTYGKRHEKLSPKSPEFWQFSWDEMALYDIPATIEKILEVSGQSQIFYVGHSQGGGIAFAALSKIPNLASKIKLFVPLAPAVYIEALKSPLRLLVPYANELEKLAELLGIGELLPNDFVTKWLAKDVCDKELPAYLCENFLFILCGFDEKQMNVSRLPVYIGQHPAGTSTQNVIHFVQMIKTGQFQMFDFGPEGNMKKYNQSTPPMYDLGQVTVPVALFSGTNDWLVVPNDIIKLSMQTKTIVQNKVLNGWEHLDFIWALDAPGQCYNDILELFKKYT